MDKCVRPGCRLAGDSFGDCGGTHGCPRAQPVDFRKDVVLSCVKCSRTWALPVNQIVQGKHPPIQRNCPQTECAAVVVHPTTSKNKKAATDDSDNG